MSQATEFHGETGVQYHFPEPDLGDTDGFGIDAFIPFEANLAIRLHQKAKLILGAWYSLYLLNLESSSKGIGINLMLFPAYALLNRDPGIGPGSLKTFRPGASETFKRGIQYLRRAGFEASEFPSACVFCEFCGTDANFTLSNDIELRMTLFGWDGSCTQIS